jgi:hypothetical protein
MHPHPLFGQEFMRARQAAINESLRFAHFETEERPARRPFLDRLRRHAPGTPSSETAFTPS